MTDDSTQVVREIYEAFDQGDMDGVFARLDEDIDWREPAGYFASTGGLPGQEGVKKALERYPEVWEWFSLDPETFHAAGELVLVLGRQSGRARATGSEFEGRFANVWRVREGKAQSFEAFSDTALMWKAMGEQPAESALKGDGAER